MNIKFFLSGAITLLMMAVSLGSAQAQYDTIPWDGLERTYLVHLPVGYSGNEPLPLVIAMHGGVGNAFNIENQSLFSEEADEENFIVVYPEGAPSFINIRTWNAGNCCGSAMNNNIDDVGFINALLDQLISELAIDETRIYATGISNGGMMAYRLACELSDRIAAIGPVACSMVVTGCSPVRPVPIIQFHSYLDDNIPYLGGVGNGLSDHYNPPLDSAMMVWSQKNECAIIAETIVENEEYTQIKSSDCACLSEVQHIISTDGGHSWHGGNGTVIGDDPSTFIDATDLMWEFFNQHSLECNVIDGVNNVSGSEFVKVYPNPSSGIFQVAISGNQTVVEMRLTGLDGKEMKLRSNESQLDLTHLPSGVYLLKVTTYDGVYSKRLIYQK